MQAQLCDELERAIKEWLSNHLGTDLWPKIIIGKRTAEKMAQAAACVFDACEESQEHALREGYYRRI